MADVLLSPELVSSVEQLARSLLTAARAVSFYPPEHPAVGAAIDRLHASVRQATSGVGLVLSVTPGSLLVEGVEAGSGGPVAECAALLHQHDLLHVGLAGEVPHETLRAFLGLLSTAPEDVRADGGPAAVWARGGHTAIALQEVDYRRVLEDRESRREPVTRDDLWRSIVLAVTERHKMFDEASQRRLLEIAGNVDAIGALALDVMAPAHMADGSPMITTQAAAVLAAYRHLSGIVSVMAPERRDEVMRNLADAVTKLDPHVVLQVLSARDEPAEGGGVVTGVVHAFDDLKVAQLLATTLAIDGRATQRLAAVFDTIAPDEGRKQRVLRLTQSLLKETDFGRRTQFESLWSSMEELLLTGTEQPFLSSAYRTALDHAGARGETMAAAELPPEAAEWVHTLGQENVRRLSVTMMIDLLNLERDAGRAPELAADLATLTEDLLLSGEYDQALRTVQAMAAKAADEHAVTSAPCRHALDQLAASPITMDAVELFGEMDEATADVFDQICQRIGPAITDALRPLLAIEEPSRGRARATDIVVRFGAAAIGRLGSLVSSEQWFAQRNAAEILGRIGTVDAVPFLQALIRGTDPRVAREAVRGLSGIDDPAAARAVHTVLRASTGPVRQAVVAALVAERDPRVVPVLLRILNESHPFRADHPIVLDTLAALGLLGQDAAIPDVVRLMRRRGLFRRRRIRAVKQRSLEALRAINTPKATDAIRQAATTGDRMLRRLAGVIPT